MEKLTIMQEHHSSKSANSNLAKAPCDSGKTMNKTEKDKQIFHGSTLQTQLQVDGIAYGQRSLPLWHQQQLLH